MPRRTPPKAQPDSYISYKDPVFIWSHEHGAWWRPASKGYCLTIALAGIYERKEAQQIVDSSQGKNEMIVELLAGIELLQSQSLAADRELLSIRRHVETSVSKADIWERS